MLKFISLSLLQSAVLALGQIFLKLATGRMDHFAWTWSWFKAQLLNYHLAIAGFFLGAATILWFYILRHFAFSIAYPMTATAYLFGMAAAVIVFKEPVPLLRWIGALLMVSGVCLILKA